MSKKDQYRLMIFYSCLIRVSSTYKKTGVSYKYLEKIAKTFSAYKRRNALGLSHVVLYEQLINAIEPWITFTLGDFIKAKFCNDYVYNDSRLEGVDLEKSKTVEIVIDLRIHGTQSQYCSEKFENELDVAGHALMYNYMFELSMDDSIDVFPLVKLQETVPLCSISGIWRFFQNFNSSGIRSEI